MASPIRAVGDRVPASGRGDLFDAAYYAARFTPEPYSRNDLWLRFFGGIANELVRSLRPSRVFDAGCAMGMLVESFWDRGVEAWGADISRYAISCVRRDMRPHCRVASIAEPLGHAVDLDTCIEVLEHMPEEEACLAIAQFAEASDVVLFSSTPDDLDEPTHINVHPLIYWLKLFRESGFAPDLNYDAGFVCPHAMLLRKVRHPFDDDVLVSFAEKLRLKTAVVERDQRIGELGTRIEQLATANAELLDKSRAAEGALTAAAERAAADLAAAKRTATELVAQRAADLAAAERRAAERVAQHADRKS